MSLLFALQKIGNQTTDNGVVYRIVSCNSKLREDELGSIAAYEVPYEIASIYFSDCNVISS